MSLCLMQHLYGSDDVAVLDSQSDCAHQHGTGSFDGFLCFVAQAHSCLVAALYTQHVPFLAAPGPISHNKHISNKCTVMGSSAHC